MRHLPPSELPREVTSPVPLLLGRYGLGTVCGVRFGRVSGSSSGFPARQPFTFLLPSTRPYPFSVNGSQVRVLPRELRRSTCRNEFQAASLDTVRRKPRMP